MRTGQSDDWSVFRTVEDLKMAFSDSTIKKAIEEALEAADYRTTI